MENKLLGISTLVVTFVTILVCFLLIYIPDVHSLAESFNEQYGFGRNRIEELEQALKAKQEGTNYVSLDDLLEGHQLRLGLSGQVTPDEVTVQSSYVNRITSIQIEGVDAAFFDDSPILGNANHIEDVTYSSDEKCGTIDIKTDSVLEVKMTRGEDCVFFDFVNPHDIYDYIVVVDAGHGGAVPGATKMGITEKQIDLDIVLQLKKLFDQTDKNIGVYYTRTIDNNPSFANRVGLANNSDADLFLSVHNNSTASGRMSNVCGTEVMYHYDDSTGKSIKFAELCLNKLVSGLNSKNKGLVNGDEIYIIRESKAPVALVEVGFMTNEQELNKLCDEDYQEKCAQALYDSVIEYLYEEK